MILSFKINPIKNKNGSLALLSRHDHHVEADGNLALISRHDHNVEAVELTNVPYGEILGDLYSTQVVNSSRDPQVMAVLLFEGESIYVPRTNPTIKKYEH